MIHLQGALGLAPLATALQEAIEHGKLLIGRRGQLDQFVGILVGEPVKGSYPGAMELVAHHSPLAIELYCQAPGGATLALAEAEGSHREVGREHRHTAAGQVKAAGPPEGLLIQGATGGHEPARIGHMDPDAPTRVSVGLERESVVDFAGVGVVDRHGFEAGEIQAGVVAGPGLVGASGQIRRQGEQLWTESGRPGGARQAGEAMGVPEAQVAKQAADLAAALPAASRLQGLAQFRRW